MGQQTEQENTTYSQYIHTQYSSWVVVVVVDTGYTPVVVGTDYFHNYTDIDLVHHIVYHILVLPDSYPHPQTRMGTPVHPQLLPYPIVRNYKVDPLIHSIILYFPDHRYMVRNWMGLILEYSMRNQFFLVLPLLLHTI